MIIGLDEVGRGAWAGPLVVAAVGLGGGEIDGLTDSKLLTKKKREKLSHDIKQIAPLVGIGWVSARDLDTIGLSEALKLASRRAMSQLDLTSVTQIIIDGTIRLIDDQRVTLMKKADLLVPSVSAASIIAKVARDQYMALCDQVFEGYNFASHVGYGAAKHRQAIESHGVLPIHRQSFAPIAAYCAGHPGCSHGSLSPTSASSLKVKQAKKNTTLVGGSAEDAAAHYLARHGYHIVDRNWKTKWCEIDIIATKHEVIYFVEVKYRKNANQGGGVAAITPRKLNQMRFAAALWLHAHGESNAQLGIIEVSEDFLVTQYIENIDL